MAPLSADEAYYWVWSRALAPGYLDHPPMVALWIRAGTALAGQGAFGIRLLGPLAAALGSVLLARAAEDLFPGRRLGVPAAVLLNATLLLGAGAVTMTPDTPLLLFWTAALWALARLHATGRAGWWLAVGVLAGAALDSKYTAALLGLGIALWLAGAPEGRRWLRTPWPWAGGALAALCFAPVLWWNAGHGWASFAKQGGRTGDWRPAEALGHVAELLGSQLGLGTPGVAVLCAAGIGWAARRWRQPRAGAAGGADRAGRAGVPAACAGGPGAGELAGDPVPRRLHRRRRLRAAVLAAGGRRWASRSRRWSTCRPPPPCCRCRAGWTRR